ncbi:MAG TPA: hypothetical protein VL727_23215 [Puia sp.]|nr:hypothetical protein [Puia sp.]
MAKEFYDVSYKTYHNERLKPVLFRGVKTYPLYVQVTYDRRSIFFKSYYFELFAQPKYDFLETSIQDINELESRVIEYIINRRPEWFDLDELIRAYKKESRDILDSFDGSFKVWLGDFLREKDLPGLAAQMESNPGLVAGIRLWDDLKAVLKPEVYKRMEERVFQYDSPYIPLAWYMREKFPDRPFCLSWFEWIEEQGEVEIFLDRIRWGEGFEKVIRAIRDWYRE